MTFFHAKYAKFNLYVVQVCKSSKSFACILSKSDLLSRYPVVWQMEMACINFGPVGRKGNVSCFDFIPLAVVFLVRYTPFGVFNLNITQKRGLRFW